MPIGNLNQIVRDGALGIIPSLATNLLIAFGTCSLGTANTLYTLASIDDCSSILGAGPLAEYCAYQLGIAGGQMLACPINPSVAGVSGAVTPTRVGTSTGTVTTATAPNDAYSVIVQIASSGTGQLVTSGNVQAKVSFDGGLTFGPNLFVPTSGTLVLQGTGITLTFSVTSTTFDLGDKFSFTCQAPFYGSSDLTTAFAAAIASSQVWSLAYCVGYPTVGNSAANATASATLASSLDSNMTTAFNNNHNARALMEAPPSLDTDLQTSFANFTSTRTRIVAGTSPITSPMTGRQLTRNFGWTNGARLAQFSPSVSPGRISDGGMRGVISINRDERKTPGLFDSRFGVSATYLGLSGFYSDIGVTMAPVGSDFGYIMRGRVIDTACTYGRAAGLRFLNSAIRVNAQTGTILETDAVGIEQYIASQIAPVINPDISPGGLSVTVNRTDNILSTNLLRIKIRVVPLGYAANIQEDIGFTNPALVLT